MYIRGTTQITEIAFRHLPDSNKPFAFTQQYGRSLLVFFRSFDSEVIGHLENSAIVLHRPTTLCKLYLPTVFVTVFFVIFKCKRIITLNIIFVKSFLFYFLSPRISADSSLILYFKIFPAAFIGNSFTKRKYLGTLCLAIDAFPNSFISFSSEDSPL